MIQIEELLKETGSHLYAEMVGQERAGSQAEVAGIILAQAYLNIHRDTKRQPKPFELPSPLGHPDPNADVTPERRAELEQQLQRRSAFPDM